MISRKRWSNGQTKPEQARTDVYGIEAAAAGTLMLVVRLFDAVTDPAMGAIADRTRTKHGRYRPWMLWIAIPYGLLAVVAFITPNAEMGTKLVYAYISYALLMTAYTAVNVPYMAMVGGFLVTSSVFWLAALFGGGEEPENYQVGFPRAMMILSTIGVLCFLGCFKLTREYVNPDQKQKRNPLRDLQTMFANSQWLIMALATLIIMTRGAMQSATKPYFVDICLQFYRSTRGWQQRLAPQPGL